MSDPDSASPRAALDRGREALAHGAGSTAIAWFDRAARLLPGNPAVCLLRASALLEHDRAACRDALDTLIAAYPRFRDPRILRIACESRDNRPEAAAAALVALLRNFAPPAENGFTTMATRVAAGAGVPGWIGLGADGTVTLAPKSARVVTVMLDGARVPLHNAARTGVLTATLPANWRSGRWLTATRGGTDLLGSPLDVSPFARTEGVFGVGPDGVLGGWAWHPADPDRPVELEITRIDAETGHRTTANAVARDEVAAPGDTDGVDRHRAFRVEAGAVSSNGHARVAGPDGRDLAGSPLRFGCEETAAAAASGAIGRRHPLRGAADATVASDPWRPLPASLLAHGPAHRPKPLPARAPVDVVIPVFRHAADFIACLGSLRGNLPPGARIIVVDDAAPGAALRDALEVARQAGEVEIIRHATNRGFPAAANTGLRASAMGEARDVLLLNCDTLSPPGLVERLANAAYSSADIGSVTPMTNDGTILSYPRTDTPNPVPDLAETRALNTAFRTAHTDALVDIPTGIGFCMFMRHDCLAEVGLFREDIFAQGYGEENDWSLRAAHLGWRHVAAAGVFVGHVGGRSFGAVKSHLIARNAEILNRLHPGYDRLIADYIARDPLAVIRRGVDLVRWREQRAEGGTAVVLITHHKAGGVARHVRERCAAILAGGDRPIVLHPGEDEASCRVSDGRTSGFENLIFMLPGERGRLISLLAEERPRHVELHHLMGHAPGMLNLASDLGIGLDVYVHDYAQWCPRVTLVSYGEKYCGEPTRVEDCMACVADLGSRLEEPIEVAALRARSHSLLRGARAVIAPSEDTARRIRRHFPGTLPVVEAWENEAGLAAALAQARLLPATPAGGRARIVVPGAIGYDKGYDVVLACARDAMRRDLAIEFVVVGYTVDDRRLLDTGHAFVTGRYEEAEGADMVAAQHAAVGFIPSVWPETWCYALSMLWRGGLRAVAFDIGAQAERIRRADAGWVLPIGLPAPRVNDMLLRLTSLA